jgi:hypothetical protein
MSHSYLDRFIVTELMWILHYSHRVKNFYFRIFNIHFRIFNISLQLSIEIKESFKLLSTIEFNKFIGHFPLFSFQI